MKFFQKTSRFKSSLYFLTIHFYFLLILNIIIKKNFFQKKIYIYIYIYLFIIINNMYLNIFNFINIF